MKPANLEQFPIAAVGPVAHAARMHAALSVSYRPRFAFLKGL